MKLKHLLVMSIFVVLSSMSLHAMTTNGNKIINSNGEVVELKGINWFGFNNQSTMVDGLWGGTDSISFDFETVVYRMKLLGFNAIRLPFSFKDLYQLTPRQYAQSCTVASQSAIQASVTNPSVTVPAGDTIPPLPYSVPRAPGMCNDYLPNDTVINRFLWVVNFFARNGFYVLIDNHLREDQTVLENQSQWLQLWTQLVTSISADPISKNMLMVDILNEPDNFGIRWEASGSVPSLSSLYLQAMDALYAVNPNVLYFIEGTGQGGIGANWGDGFATDPQLISQNGLSDPTTFFTTLLSKPYLNQVVIAPHIYPPSVTGATTNYTGTGLWNRMTNSFGYLTQKGFCSGSTCKIFPVVIGEFGSLFAAQNDINSMTDMASYFNNSGAAADGKHQAITSWFYWAWNADSGDTGGIVQDNWRDIIWTKVDYLSTIGLEPWYYSPVNQTYGTLCLSLPSVTGLTISALQPISAGSYTYQFKSFNTPVCQKLAVGSYTVTAPRIIIGNQQYDAASQSVNVTDGGTTTAEVLYKATTIPNPPATTCTVKVALGAPWQENGVYKNSVNLYITNNGSTAITAPWILQMSNPSYKKAENPWNITVLSVSQGGTIKGSVSNSWETLNQTGPTNNTVNVGMIVSSSTNSFMPTSISINGQPAKITK